jgi:hypothetical protein
MKFDYSELYKFVFHLPATSKIRNLRLTLLLNYWYAEDYEKVYDFITELGGTIE